ncbi:hypothetical protein C5Y96_13400 [Blastopirellula marina]|uniref:Uncharacterized protein n=1 Tax=Blastopirellula marina TaxID=124 RepID=A0A2S8FGQ8_9BACT|nr:MULTISPECIES: hypothetical protein [Pirellulaceae]PQO31332.1 hypothetical protein C5Y96_13400 [Blastopirellula marina]RCS51726.1 hypothetical protein DTL36_13410 [Bremerella cremea]
METKLLKHVWFVLVHLAIFGQGSFLLAAPPEVEETRSAFDDPALFEMELEPPAKKQFQPLEPVRPKQAEPVVADQSAAPGLGLPDLRHLHQQLPKAVEKIREMLLPVESPQQPDPNDITQPMVEPVETLMAPPEVDTLPPVAVSPWRDPVVQLPVASQLPPLERMPLVAYRPDTRNRDNLYRVGDEPESAADVLPSIEPPKVLPPVDAARPVTYRWPKTPHLDAMLKRLDEYPETKTWASDLRLALQKLREESTIGTLPASQHLKHLSEITSEAVPMVDSLDYGWQRTDITQTYYALLRRIDLWNAAHNIIHSGIQLSASPTTLGNLQQHLEQSEAILRDGGQLLSWSDYLRLKQLRQAMESNASPQQMQEVANEVLVRLEGGEFDEAQKQLLAQAPFVNLANSLRPWLGINFNPEKTLAAVERYEQDQSAAEAKLIAMEANILQHHAEPSIIEFGQLIDHTYRNANTRFEVSQQFMQAFMPELQPDEAAVNDFILGARVLGRSRSVTRLHVRPVPDHQQWRIQLEVLGNVDSQTTSHSGPVKIFNRGRSRYHAAKQVVVNSKGFWVSPAVARADTTTSVDNLESDYDGIPLIGSIVRSVARGQTEEKKYAAEAEVERKVRHQAESKLNEQLNDKVQQWQDKLYVDVVQPLVRLGLDPSVVDLNTSSRSISGRFRAAGPRHLAAHTPRPSSPIDSVLSAQLHQSGLNNLIRQLRLGGRELTPKEFLMEVGTRFPAIQGDVDEELPAEVAFTFSEEDPIRVEFNDGQAQLTLRIDTLKVGDNSWEDLEVSALYSPTSVDFDAKLVRDSTVFLKGKRLGFRDQIALRAVFLKVLSKKHEIPLFPEGAKVDPRLAEFQVNQLALHEGWLAVSLGPKNAPMQERKLFRVADEPQRTSR